MGRRNRRGSARGGGRPAGLRGGDGPVRRARRRGRGAERRGARPVPHRAGPGRRRRHRPARRRCPLGPGGGRLGRRDHRGPDRGQRGPGLRRRGVGGRPRRPVPPHSQPADGRGVSALTLARAVWRLAAPRRLRLKLAPTLDRRLKDYVRAGARRPHGSDNTEGPIRIVGYFSGDHGIAASAKLAARAFETLGVPVERVDATHAKLGWTPKTAPLEPAAAWIFHLNAPELLAELATLGPRRVIGPRYGVWAWELPVAPAGWRKDAALLDEVWAPSRYTALAFAEVGAPVRVTPHPLFLDDYRDVTPAPRRAAFQAVALFDFNSSAARKNPQGVIEAFRRAFDDDASAELTIKTQNGHGFPDLLAALRAEAPANVRIVDETWPYAEVKALIAGSDALISLHRAEGFGLAPAEALALGCPVVATAYSGVLDFLDATNALLVPYRDVPVDDPQGIYTCKGATWAEPDVEAAAAALRRLRADPGLGARLAAAGRRTVAERLTPEAWFKTLPEKVQAAALRLKAAG
ncbi:MAG: glycosyltransferase family 1 protein [Phenylobacterium sp.]|nr:MAG: glycosyltransferase family 1 protein [Phenylobacterium sp.]